MNTHNLCLSNLETSYGQILAPRFLSPVDDGGDVSCADYVSYYMKMTKRQSISLTVSDDYLDPA